MPDFLECAACGERFFFGEGGIPFMGKYAKSACVALVEISAVARTVPRRTTPQFEVRERACEKYWELGDDVFPRYGIDRQYFPFRYAEGET